MLRPYQKKAVDQIRAKYRKGIKKALLHLDTGGGKTVIFSDIMKATSDRGKKCVMVVRGRKLVDQAHKRLLREGVFHGVIMAGHWAFNRMAPIQICSIDTLNSRSHYPEADLVVYDEAHNTVSKSYVDFVKHYPDAYHLAVTATPYVEKSLRHVADCVIRPISMDELIAQGYLVPPIYYAPSSVDVSGVKVSRGTNDYVTADLEAILNGNDIVGNLVQTWRDFGQNRSTLIFAVSIVHSKHIAQTFREAGITAEHCDADTPDKERDAVIARLESGETKVVVNVGIFCTGIDIPSLGCILMARPTKSYNLYIQQAGRGTRPAPNKNDFLLLDNAGNVLRHGFINDQPECNLDGTKIKESVSPIKTCKSCFAIFNQFKKQCPQCGHANTTTEKEREITEVDGTLERIEQMPIEAKAFQEFKRLQKVKKEKKFKRGWIWHKMKEQFGEKIASKYVPKMEVPEWIKR